MTPVAALKEARGTLERQLAAKEEEGRERADALLGQLQCRRVRHASSRAQSR